LTEYSQVGAAKAALGPRLGRGVHTPWPRKCVRRSSLKIIHWKIFRALIAPWDIFEKMNLQDVSRSWRSMAGKHRTLLLA
ncbi:MAG: hypothetical protein ABIV25_04445, partial [Paracoccaceae bacterium]